MKSIFLLAYLMLLPNVIRKDICMWYVDIYTVGILDISLNWQEYYKNQLAREIYFVPTEKWITFSFTWKYHILFRRAFSPS